MALEMDVNMMLPKDVPMAMCMATSGEMFSHWKEKTSMGTTTAPPPMPRRPARRPATAPRTQ